MTDAFTRSLLGAALLLILFLSTVAPSEAATIPSTAGWLDIANTQIRSVCPPDNFGGSGYAFTSYCNGVIDAWNGGVFDTARNRFIIWGGGHHDYSGNEVYALNMNTLTLSRLTDPAVPVATACPEYLANGTQPNSRHTAIGSTGEGVGGDHDSFNGSIDDVRVYNRGLSASEIQQVYAYTGR